MTIVDTVEGSHMRTGQTHGSQILRELLARWVARAGHVVAGCMIKLQYERYCYIIHVISMVEEVREFPVFGRSRYACHLSVSCRSIKQIPKDPSSPFASRFT